jgi:hypothetical protein
MLYWRHKPAIVPKEEIEVIREFTSGHENVIVEKTKVDVNEVAKMIGGSRYSIDGNIVRVKNTTLKVNLPTIGYALIAQVETENPLQTEVSFGKKDLLLH